MQLEFVMASNSTPKTGQIYKRDQTLQKIAALYFGLFCQQRNIAGFFWEGNGNKNMANEGSNKWPKLFVVILTSNGLSPKPIIEQFLRKILENQKNNKSNLFHIIQKTKVKYQNFDARLAVKNRRVILKAAKSR